MLKNKKIIIGVTASIAAYKTASLIRLLVKEGAEVRVVMTSSAIEFITPLTLSTLSKNPVLHRFVKNEEGEWNNHVELGLWADLMVIAPASANTIAKMASGLCDNLLMAVYLSARCPVHIAPAMDLDMFRHKATAENLQRLQSFGNTIIRPGTGELASGLFGEGRMAEPEEIIEHIKKTISAGLPLQGKTALVTAGPTYEAIDPVRFIGNHSSGKMGFALAEELASQGAEVILVCGPNQLTLKNKSIRRIDVVSADELFDASVEAFKSCDFAILSAAVADYRPAKVAGQKIKKTDASREIELVPTKDTLAELGKRKKKNQLLIGFALETENETSNAKAKISKKNLDLIVLNSLNDKGAGFKGDTNKITLIDKNNKTTKFELKSKQEVAKDIIKAIIGQLKKKKNVRKIVSIAFLFLVTGLQAQELNCQVQVLSQQIQGTDRRVFETLQTAIYEFMNNKKWTNESFKNDERIDCSILINLTEKISNDEYKGTLQIQSRRPIFKTSYNSVLLNYNDNDIQFRYLLNAPLEFNENSHLSNLTSILGYYAYLIIGLDYDSFALNGGTPYLQKALAVANNAQNAEEPGWRAFDNNKNRYWMINNMLDASFIPLRECMYRYHRKGLDIMVDNKETGRTEIYESLLALRTIHEIKPLSFSMQVFFNAKSDEVVNIFSGAFSDEKSKIVTLVNELDPTNSNKYQKILQ